MNREQLTSATKHYASLTAALLFGALETTFSWLAERCNDTYCYFSSVWDALGRRSASE